MDGTLTLPVHDFNAIRAELGIEPDRPILEAISALPKKEADELSRRLHEIEMQIAKLAVVQPGAVELLEQIRSRDCRLGILTRNDEEIAHATLKASGLDEFFEQETVIGRELCLPKPAPDGVQFLLDHWRAPASDTVMVGDYRFDIEAGHRAGVHTVHFDSTATFNWPEYMSHGVTRLADISRLISET